MDRRQKYTNITTAATTTIKSGIGVLASIVVNKPVSAATITIYDNTAASGTKIATITLTADLKPFFLDFDCFFQTGLTIVTSGATDLTVVTAA